MEKSQKNERGSIMLPRDTYRKLKIMSAVTDRSIGDLVTEMVDESVSKLPDSTLKLAQVLSN